MLSEIPARMRWASASTVPLHDADARAGDLCALGRCAACRYLVPAECPEMGLIPGVC